MHKSAAWPIALVVIAFMVLIFMTCDRTDDRIGECIKLGKDPHVCACTFASSYTSGCR